MATQIPAPPTVASVNNINIASLNRLMNRIIFELHSSSATNVEWVRSPDLKRFKANLERYEAEVEFAKSITDTFDMPETKDWIEALEPPEAITEVENEYINYLLSFLNRWRFETITCQSVRQQMGIKPPDYDREKWNIKEIRRTISEVIEKTQPMDFPASSPQEGPGGSPRN